MSFFQQSLLCLSALVICVELALFVKFYHEVLTWIHHHIWVVLLPFAKTLIKHIGTLKITDILKLSIILLWHIVKLAVSKGLKTLGIRYGIFFSQYRWRIIREIKIVFLRKGKKAYRSVAYLWQQYSTSQKNLILSAFFPIVLILFLLGISFNVTRKILLQKTQETAVAKVAAKTGKKNRTIIKSIIKADKKILEKIKSIKD